MKPSRKRNPRRSVTESLESRTLLAGAGPTLVVTAPPAAEEGKPYAISFAAEVGGEPVSSWTINWGDGEATTLPGGATSASHVYRDGPRLHGLWVRATTATGSYAAYPAGKAPGSLDTTFGGGDGIAASGMIGDVAVQPDGKLVAIWGGEPELSAPWRVLRFNPDGSPDATFGTNGYATASPVADQSYLMAVAVQPDGRIVVAGYSPVSPFDSRRRPTLARYNGDGSLDTTFGTGGFVVTPMGTNAFGVGTFDKFDDVTVLPDGSILAGGHAAFSNADPSQHDAFVAKFRPDGSIDTSYGVGGRTVPVDFGNQQPNRMWELAVLPDGRVLFAGEKSFARELGLIRFTAGGALDPTFGNGGKVVAPLSPPGVSGQALAALPDGSVYVAGDALGPDMRTRHYAIARYRPDGTPDPAFGGDGFLPFDSLVYGLAVQPDGYLLIGGGGESEYALTRLAPDGQRDPSFGDAGRMSTPMGGAPRFTVIRSLELQGDGTVVAAGFGGLAKYHVGAWPVSVADVTPTLILSGPATAFAGDEVRFNFFRQDPGADTGQAWVIDWGDGTTTTLAPNANSAAHTYTAGGPYTVRATYTDEDGAHSVTRDFHSIALPTLTDDGTLVVRGGPLADTIDFADVFASGAIIVTLNDRRWVFDRDDVDRIDVATLAGNDLLQWPVLGMPPISFDGGTGRDEAQLWGWGGDDVFELNETALTHHGRAAGSISTAVEQVTFVGSAGHDTVRVSATVSPQLGTGTGVLLDGGEGNDTLDVRSAGYARLIGGFGNDVAILPDEMWAGPSSVDGGDGNDSVTWNASDNPTGGINQPPSIHDVIFVNSTSFTGGGISPIQYSGVETMTLNGNLGDDRFLVVTPMPTARLVLNGGAGDDVVESFASGGTPTAKVLNGDVLFNGGEGGFDSVTLADFTREGWLFDVTDAGVAISAAGRTSGQLGYSGVELLTLHADDGVDSVGVTPSANTTFNLNGGTPNAAPGDVVTVNPAGATLTNFHPGGRYEFAGHRPIVFSGMESYTDLVPPTTLSAGFEPPTRTLTVWFNEPLDPASLDPSDLRVVSRLTGAAVVPESVTWNAAARSARYTFGPLDPGVYGATLLGRAVSDVAGNWNVGDSDTVFAVSGVIARHVFYNNSALDDYDSREVDANNRALASDKVALLPGQAASFANVTGYSKGINGVMIDVAGIPYGGVSTLSPQNFTFHVSRTGRADDWTGAPAPREIFVTWGAGVGDSDRIAISWPDGAIRNTWLRVTIGNYNDETRLPGVDTFYFGNLVGETGLGAPGSQLSVGPSDLVATRNASLLRSAGAPVPVTNRFDHNRDGRVNATDLALARRALFSSIPLIAPPAAAPAAAVLAGGAEDRLLSPNPSPLG